MQMMRAGAWVGLCLATAAVGANAAALQGIPLILNTPTGMQWNLNVRMSVQQSGERPTVVEMKLIDRVDRADNGVPKEIARRVVSCRPPLEAGVTEARLEINRSGRVKAFTPWVRSEVTNPLTGKTEEGRTSDPLKGRAQWLEHSDFVFLLPNGRVKPGEEWRVQMKPAMFAEIYGLGSERGEARLQFVGVPANKTVNAKGKLVAQLANGSKFKAELQLRYHTACGLPLLRKLKGRVYDATGNAVTQIIVEEQRQITVTPQNAGTLATDAALRPGGTDSAVTDADVRAFMRGLREHDPDAVQGALEKGLNPNYGSDPGTTPVDRVRRRIAKCTDDLAEVEAILRRARADGKNKSEAVGEYNRLTAELKDWRAIGRFLVKHKGLTWAQLRAKAVSDEDANALRLAITRTATDPAYVVTAGRRGWPPLKDAVLRGHFGTADYLLEQGDDVNARGSDKRTILHEAATAAARPAVDFLLQRHADPNLPDTGGQTPLHATAAAPRAEKALAGIASALLARGGDAQRQDREGRTALHIALAARKSLVAEVLAGKSNGGDQGVAGKATPLLKAAGDGHPKVVPELLKSGAGVNAQDENGDTPLHRALRQ